MSGGLLEGVLVLDMSQFLSGPFAALRLRDLGARVIKIERPDGGDLCRRLYLSDTEIGGDSTLFHAINRGKQGFAADFKNPADIAAINAPNNTVISGDTLWAIAERFYGDGTKYQVIADASGVSNPDLIYPGQVLTIPLSPGIHG